MGVWTPEDCKKICNSFNYCNAAVIDKTHGTCYLKGKQPNTNNDNKMTCINQSNNDSYLKTTVNK